MEVREEVRGVLWRGRLSAGVSFCAPFRLVLFATSRLTSLDYRALLEYGMRDMPASVIRGYQWLLIMTSRQSEVHPIGTGDCASNVRLETPGWTRAVILGRSS